MNEFFLLAFVSVLVFNAGWLLGAYMVSKARCYRIYEVVPRPYGWDIRLSDKSYGPWAQVIGKDMGEPKEGKFATVILPRVIAIGDTNA